MDAETLRLNHDRYVETCRTHIHRQGLDDILERLEQNGFFEAPSSASYHLNEPGGLCLHSLNVFDTAVTIYKHIAEPAILGGTSPFTSEVSMESLAICTFENGKHRHRRSLPRPLQSRHVPPLHQVEEIARRPLGKL